MQIRTLLLSALFSLSFASIACAQSVVMPYETTFLSTSNEMQFNGFNGLKVANVYQYSESSDGSYLIYTVPSTTSFKLYTVNQVQPSQQTLISTGFNTVKYPVINDDGEYAYEASSKVYLNGSVITTQSGLYKYLAIDTDYLAFSDDQEKSPNTNGSGVDRYTHALIVYNLGTQSPQAYTVPGLIQKMRFFGNDLVLQVFNLSKQQLIVYKLDPTTGQLEQVVNNSDNQYFTIKDNNVLTIESVEGDVPSLIYFNALHLWKQMQVANPFAFMNNDTANLSWLESFWLLGLDRLYSVTQSSAVLDQIRNSVTSIVNQAQTSGTEPLLWPTRQYSLDHSTEIASVPNNALILYALLKIANDGLVPSLKSQIINLGKLGYQEIDSTYNRTNDSLFHHPYGIDIQRDGIWLPFNQQSLVGLAFIELYKATGDNKYISDLTSAAKKFSAQWAVSSDGRLLWQYATAAYYAGWDASQNISLHDPSQSAVQAPLHYEDVSHAAINVAFIQAYNQIDNGQYFSSAEKSELQKTLTTLLANHNYGCEMNSYAVSYRANRCIPRFGWAMLGVSGLNADYAKGIPIEDSYANVLDSYMTAFAATNLNDVSVTITQDQYEQGFSQTGHAVETLTGSEMADYFAGHLV